MERDIKARRIRFRYPAGAMRRHYVQDDLGMSHLVSVLSGAFPEGEAFMIRSVRAVAGQITDPELKSRSPGSSARKRRTVVSIGRSMNACRRWDIPPRLSIGRPARSWRRAPAIPRRGIASR